MKPFFWRCLDTLYPRCLLQKGEMNISKPVALGIGLGILTIGILGFMASDDDEVEASKEDVLEAAEEEEGPMLSKHTDALIRAAAAARSKGDNESAASLYARVLIMAKKDLGDEHPLVATILGSLGSVLLSLERPAEAEEVYRKCLGIIGTALGENHATTGTVLNNLGSALLAQTKLTEAENFYRRALAVCEVVHGAGHVESATALGNLAVVLQDQVRGALWANTRSPGSPPPNYFCRFRFHSPALRPGVLCQSRGDVRPGPRREAGCLRPGP